MAALWAAKRNGRPQPVAADTGRRGGITAHGGGNRLRIKDAGRFYAAMRR